MVLFGGDEMEPVMILTRRSLNLRTHRGQIGFPGGKPEPGDGSLLATAVRETGEELGVDPEQLEVWGELDPVQTMSTGFGLSVHTGRVRDIEGLNPNPAEVAEVLPVSMSVVLDPASSRDETRIVEGGAISRPSYSYNGRIVWGVTAHIIVQIVDLLRPEPQPAPQSTLRA
jgi:8-oxo-dGTP pyrophosphatase MutT (NUDIX family)